MIHIDLYGEPIPQARHRIARRGNFVHSYDPQAKLKEGYKWQIKSQYREKPLTIPVYLDITFFMPIPKSTSKRLRRQMLDGVCYHMKRPDLDNLQKFVLDCLQDLVLEDDSQVVEIRTKKIYSEKPGTLVRILPKEQLERALYASDP